MSSLNLYPMNIIYSLIPSNWDILKKKNPQTSLELNNLKLTNVN